MLAAAFQQNALQRVRAGDEAEVDGLPGRVFKAKVRELVDANAAGQLQPNGMLQDVGARPGGRALATIELTEDASAISCPRVQPPRSLYPALASHFALLRKILLRMRSWDNYFFIEGH
jgi:multidrug resistance efflux pump